MLVHRDGQNGFVLVIVRVEAAEIGRDTVEVGLRLLERNAGLEAAEDRKRVGAAQPRWGRRCEPKIGPHVELRARLKIGRFTDEVEVTRQDTDHGVARIVQTHLPTDDFGISTEVLFPGGIAEHHGAVFGWLKAAAEVHRDAEEREEIGGYVRARETARLT